MNYCLPCAKSRQTQGFGGDPKVYDPLKGHPAHDFGFTWNEPVPFIAKSYVYSKLNDGSKDPERYTALCTLVENPDDEFDVDEIIYGHGNSMPAEVGKWYDVGDTAILAGNKGMVFSWGRRITKQEKLDGSTAGTHLHLQRRPVQKVKKITKGKKYLETAKGKLKLDGYYYEIKDYENGYNGCAEIRFNGKVAKKVIHTLPYEEALANLRKGGLPKPILAMAEAVLRLKYGR